jgi:hypothetical protein
MQEYTGEKKNREQTNGQLRVAGENEKDRLNLTM